jgi:tricorn protease
LTLTLTLTLIILTLPSHAEAQTRLLRFPDLHGDQVVFTYAGDLWSAPVTGGDARRLTAHPGLELFAKFSPDGRWIAFTGQIDGDEQVYVMPAEGGPPVQLTYYPARGPLTPRWGWDNQVYGWTPDGEAVLFRGLRDGWDLTDSRLYTVTRAGGLPTALPMPVSGAGDLSPDGRQVVYSPLFRDFRSWKRYQGGWAQDLWIFDLASHDATRITDNPRSDRDPMWIGDRIYFTSDRTGTLQLYAYDIASGATEQLTDSPTWDIRWPSADETGRIVYEEGGELYLFDTRDGSSHKISIRVPSDLLDARPSRISAADDIEDVTLSPGGERTLIVARGDIFSAPAEHGATRNLTDSSDAHDKWARWSPDGSKIAFVSDRDGEEQLYLLDPKTGGTPEKLTDSFRAMLYRPAWSPDGQRIALSDKSGKLYVLTVADKSLVEVADEAQGFLLDYTWSPHGGHLAFTLNEPSGFASVWIWSVADGSLHKVTSERFGEFSPAWDPQGNYLFFLASHQFQPQLASFEWNYVVNREDGIYALALRKDVPHPFPPQSDEVKIGGDDEEKGDKEGEGAQDAEDGETQKGYVEIDFDGLGARVARVPVEDDNLSDLTAVEGHLLYIQSGPFYYGRPTSPRPSLRIFSLEDRKETTLAEDVGGYTVSADGKKVLLEQGGAYKLYDAKPGASDPKTVSTAELWVDRVPRQEWETIFDEVWRRYRDFFYVPNMHGYDWEALREQYRPLLAYVGHRSDLNYVLSEMVAELNISHAYIQGGDFEIPDRPDVALPGARFELDPEAGRYRISEIFRGDNEEPRYRAPLTEIGVETEVGDYVLAIDGEELTAGDNPYRLLRYKAEHPVTLTVNDQPTMQGAREVVFNPLDDEQPLIYFRWVWANHRRVDEATDGRVGYLHIPDMGSDGIREFIKWFYPQIRKEGLIVDVRGNGGGNVSSMLIERLRRELLAVGFARNNDRPTTYPQVVFYGPMVALINETSASDGDIFPAMFKKAGLGPLIGKRTWGGVTGISGRGPLLDGATVYVPEFGFASPEGKWIIEGHGVDPDIEVENDPKSVLEGRDPQLDRAIEEVLARMETVPHTLPERPAPPVKTP